MTLPRPLLISLTLAIALATPVTSASAADARSGAETVADAWAAAMPDSAWTPGASAALLHEEIAPDLWTVYTRESADDAFAEAGLFRVAESIALDGAAERIAAPATRATDAVRLTSQTELVRGELTAAMSEPRAVVALVTTVSYEIIESDDSVRRFTCRHVDVVSASSTGSARGAFESLASSFGVERQDVLAACLMSGEGRLALALAAAASEGKGDVDAGAAAIRVMVARGHERSVCLMDGETVGSRG